MALLLLNVFCNHCYISDLNFSSLDRLMVAAGPDDSCFLAAWALSNSALVSTYDRPKQQQSKQRGIPPF